MKIQKTETFKKWLDKLKDRVAKARILDRIKRLQEGNFGEVKGITNGQGVKEMILDFGPGYRIYYKEIKVTVVLLLVGGTKRTQDRDIKKAKELARQF